MKKYLTVIGGSIAIAGAAALAIIAYDASPEPIGNEFSPQDTLSGNSLVTGMTAREYREIFSEVLTKQSDFNRIDNHRRDMLLDQLSQLFDAWDEESPDQYISLSKSWGMAPSPVNPEDRLREDWNSHGQTFWTRFDFERASFYLVPLNPDTGNPILLPPERPMDTTMAMRQVSFVLPDDAAPATTAGENYFILRFDAHDYRDAHRVIMLPITWSEQQKRWYVLGMVMLSKKGQAFAFPPL